MLAIPGVQGDVDCQISPHSPLVSTELDENGWVCGEQREVWGLGCEN